MRLKLAVGLVVLAIATAPVLAQTVATESLSATGLSIAPQLAYEGAVLRISGPGDYSGSRTFENGEAVQVDLQSFGRASGDGRALPEGAVETDEVAMPDGRYNYEVVFWADGRQVGVHTSSFFVESGVANPGSNAAGNRENPTVTGETSGDDGGGLTESIDVDDFLNLYDTASDDSTHIWLQNSSFPTTSNWWLQNEDGDAHFREYFSGGNAPRLTIEMGGDVGIGTTAPALELHMVDGDTPTLRLEQDGSSGFSPQTWDVAGNETSFFIRDVTNGSQLPFRINPGAPSSSIHIAPGGLVGIGTSNPQTSLHHRVAEPQVLVESTGATAGRTLAYLKNNGDVRFFWENTNSGDIWQMSMLSTVLQMATPTGNGKFRVRKSGGLQALNGSTEIMALNSTGDLTVKSVTQTSSREAKNGFESVDGISVLDKVAGLPISEWSYKADNPSVRHIGPMSEDFHATFGLGKTAKGITSVDTSGVALAAIQGLNQKLTEKDARISELEQRLLELEEMVQALAEH